jgi:hypothetical protein
MSLLTDTMTIQRKMETIITTKVNFTALAIITLNLRMAVLLTEVGTLVAAIEETFQTRVPIGDFLALVLIHITMDPPNAARRGISTTCNGLHRDQEAVGDNIVLTRHTVMAHKHPIDRRHTMTRNPPELEKLMVIPERLIGMRSTTRHNPNPLTGIPSLCHPLPMNTLKRRRPTKAGNLALLSSQRLRLLLLQSQYLTLPRGCRSTSRPPGHPNLHNNLVIGLPTGHCLNSNRSQGVIVVTGTVDGIETAGNSGSHENSVIHGIAEIIVDSINVMIDDKESGPRTGLWTGKIAAVIPLQNRRQERHPSKSGFLRAPNHAPRFPRSSLMLTLCTTESRAMSL